MRWTYGFLESISGLLWLFPPHQLRIQMFIHNISKSNPYVVEFLHIVCRCGQVQRAAKFKCVVRLTHTFVVSISNNILKSIIVNSYERVSLANSRLET